MWDNDLFSFRIPLCNGLRNFSQSSLSTKKNPERKERSDQAADLNHETLDPKSFNFQLRRGHEELDDIRWLKSILISFSYEVSSARGTAGQGRNYAYEENALLRPTPLLSEDVWDNIP